MTLFDPYSSDFLDDPYPTYIRLRAETPIFHDDAWGLTFFTRHRDVAAILKDRRFGRDVRHAVPIDDIDPTTFERIYPPTYPLWTRLIRDSFIDLEPPRHTRVRRLVQWAFTRRASESYRNRLESIAAGTIERAIESGKLEAIADFATPIPLTMIAELLGVPAGDQPQLVEWSHAIVRVFDRDCSPEEGAAAENAVAEFVGFVNALLTERRRGSGDDFVSALLAAEYEGDRLDEDELVATCILMLNAGHEATVHAIGNALLALARHPAQYARLRGEPERLSNAVDELLRFDTPLQMFERWVLEDLDWDGVRLQRGSKVGLLFGSANHDDSVFLDPQSLDLDRSENPPCFFRGWAPLLRGCPAGAGRT